MSTMACVSGSSLNSARMSDEAGARDGVAADAHAGRLADARIGERLDHLVGEGAGPADQAHVARLVDGARDDAHLGLAGRGGAGAVGPDEPRALRVHLGHDLEHVQHRDVLGDAEDGADARVERLQDRRPARPAAGT